MSEQLKFQRAIFVGELEKPASELRINGEGAAQHYDQSTTFVRIVLPVELGTKVQPRTKEFFGDKNGKLDQEIRRNVAIKGIELELEQGDLFGFIGPNGAGKTTTMRIISTLLEPSYGEAYVCGHSIYNEPKEIRRLIGYMPDFFGVYDDMKVIEYLEFFAAAYRINGPTRRKKCDEMLEIVDLDFKRDAFANTLSRGQTQRLGLARVLLHDPQVLLLDEPLSGLDPRARIEMRNLLRRLGQTGKTIIVPATFFQNSQTFVTRSESSTGGS